MYFLPLHPLCLATVVILLVASLPTPHHGLVAQTSRVLTRQQQLLNLGEPPLKPFRLSNVSHTKSTSGRSFIIDRQANTFLKDGQPFRYVSGSIHYYRVPQSEWHDRLLKAKLGGLNGVQTYIEWASHEPQETVYDFSGMLNFTEYCRLAQNLGLNVIIRFGPFIASERDGMGLPYWLPAKHPKMQYRTMDPDFLFYVQRWYKVVMPLLKPLLYQNGGPILMGQIENEYGSIGKCDAKYMTWLRDLVRSYLGPDFVLFTVDGASELLIECGHVDGAYPTVDFGILPASDVNSSFHFERLFSPHGPLVNTEYYPGWFDVWGYAHETSDINGTVNTLASMLKLNASVNVYMYHGGTSFSFMNGAYFQSNPYGLGSELSPMVTSYDYDAPISDIGKLTPKYWAIRKTIQKYFPEASAELSLSESQVLSRIGQLSSSTANGNGQSERKMNLTVTATLQSTLFDVVKSMSPILSIYPLSFEELTVRHGFVLYQTQVPFRPSDPILLQVPQVHDRAHIFVNEIYRATLSRMDVISSTPLSDLRFNDTLALFVENQGHTCCSENPPEQKGIIGNVTIGGIVLTKWQHYKVFSNWSEAINANMVLGQPVANLLNASRRMNPLNRASTESNLEDCGCGLRDILRVPTFYVARFHLQHLPLRDLVLNVGECGHKGIAFMNGFNLGRYWPVMGPQVTLYIPRSTLSTSTANTLVLFELDRDQRSCLTVYLTDHHIINGSTPYNYAYEAELRRKRAEAGNTANLSHRQMKTLGVPDGFRPY